MSERKKKAVLPQTEVVKDFNDFTKKAGKKATGVWEAFRKFAFKGNVIDMAVGVVVGSAFTKIVNSVVSDLLTPFISLITGGVHFSELKWVIRPEIVEGETVIQEALTINYGNLMEAIIDFFIIAATVFAVVKLLTYKKEKAAAAAAAAAAEEEKRKAEEEANKPHEPTEVELLQKILEKMDEKREA